MTEQVARFESAIHVEGHREAIFDVSTGEPKFAMSRLVIYPSDRHGFLRDWWPVERNQKQCVLLGFSQKDKKTNHTELAIIWGEPEELDASVRWVRHKAFYKRRKSKPLHKCNFLVNFNARELVNAGDIQYPIPYGTWPGYIFIRPKNGDVFNATQALGLFAQESFTVTPTEREKEPPPQKTIIEPGDPGWINVP